MRLQHLVNSFLEVLLYFSPEELNQLANIGELSHEDPFLKLNRRKTQEKLNCMTHPLDTGYTLNVTFKRRPGYLMNLLCTCNYIQPVILVNKSTRLRCFVVNFTRFLRTDALQNTFV